MVTEQKMGKPVLLMTILFWKVSAAGLQREGLHVEATEHNYFHQLSGSCVVA